MLKSEELKIKLLDEQEKLRLHTELFFRKGMEFERRKRKEFLSKETFPRKQSYLDRATPIFLGCFIGSLVAKVIELKYFNLQN